MSGDTDHACGQGRVEDGTHSAPNGVRDARVLHAVIVEVFVTATPLCLLVLFFGPAHRYGGRGQVKLGGVVSAWGSSGDNPPVRSGDNTHHHRLYFSRFDHVRALPAVVAVGGE